jgi:protein-L-isoaspartate(D-aspartate) O-methyltransferase
MPTDYQVKRERMVQDQLAPRGITDANVLKAMRKVARHLFMPEDIRDSAYIDRAVPIGEGQTISQPFMVAQMTQFLAVAPKHRVLEVGTGSGYQCAVLAEIAKEVISIERIPSLSERAGAALREAGYDNVTLLVGDGTLGAPGHAPFDRIIVTAGAPKTPEALLRQLADGGRAVVPVGPRDLQRVVITERRGQRFEEREATRCVFVPLVGEQGWEGRPR